MLEITTHWVPLLASLLVATAEPAAEVTQPAAFTSSAMPAYPRRALRQEETGTVILRVQVLANGQVGEVRIQQSSGSADLDAAAVDAVHQSGFRAAQTRTGQAVDSWVSVPYRFVLQ